MKRKSYSRRDIRVFSVMLSLILVVIGCWGLWRESFEWSGLRIGLISGGLLILLVGLARPGLLTPALEFWMSLTDLVGRTVTLILLVILYIAFLVPIGGLRRLFGSDPMRRKRAPAGESYWLKPDSDSRGRSAYEEQF